MRAKNLEFFGKVYDMVLNLNCDDPEESLCIAGSIIAHYNWKRVKYAVEHNWHLYDLDRWEAVAREYGRDADGMIKIFHEVGINYNHEQFVRIMQDGEMFIELLVDPLYEQQDIEIVELISGRVVRTDIDCSCRETLG